MITVGSLDNSSDNFLGALKFVIANVKYYTKYVKSSLPTDSKIVSNKPAPLYLRNPYDRSIKHFFSCIAQNN